MSSVVVVSSIVFEAVKHAVPHHAGVVFAALVRCPAPAWSRHLKGLMPNSMLMLVVAGTSDSSVIGQIRRMEVLQSWWWGAGLGGGLEHISLIAPILMRVTTRSHVYCILYVQCTTPLAFYATACYDYPCYFDISNQCQSQIARSEVVITPPTDRHRSGSAPRRQKTSRKAGPFIWADLPAIGTGAEGSGSGAGHVRCMHQTQGC